MTDMASCVTADSWKIIKRDRTGATVGFECTCPNCGQVTGSNAILDPEVSDNIENGFTTGCVCEICDEELEVVCNSHTMIANP